MWPTPACKLSHEFIRSLHQGSRNRPAAGARHRTVQQERTESSRLRSVQAIPGVDPGNRKIGEHAIDAEPHVVLHLDLRIGEAVTAGVVAEGPRMDAQALRVRELDDAGAAVDAPVVDGDRGVAGALD